MLRFLTLLEVGHSTLNVGVKTTRKDANPLSSRAVEELVNVVAPYEQIKTMFSTSKQAI